MPSLIVHNLPGLFLHAAQCLRHTEVVNDLLIIRYCLQMFARFRFVNRSIVITWYISTDKFIVNICRQ